MEDYGVTDHIRFSTEVTAARWDEPSATWTVETTDGTFVANALISAVGQLNRPKLPDIEGLPELYGRSVFHCPYCDGWEIRDQPMAVYGRD